MLLPAAICIMFMTFVSPIARHEAPSAPNENGKPSKHRSLGEQQENKANSLLPFLGIASTFEKFYANWRAGVFAAR